MSNASSSSTIAGPDTIDIAGLLTELDLSGQSAAAFARDHGIAPWKVYYARQRRRAKREARRRSGRAGKRNLIPVRVVDARAAGRVAPLELVVAGGHRLLVPADFDETALRRLLGVLAGC